MYNMDAIIEKALSKAPKMKDGEIGLAGTPLKDGMVLAIEYHTIGKTNICDSYEQMTAEHFDWKKAGCKNAEDWRRYLNKNLWSEYKAGLR